MQGYFIFSEGFLPPKLLFCSCHTIHPCNPVTFYKKLRKKNKHVMEMMVWIYGSLDKSEASLLCVGRKAIR
mgnify:CR=1 FL=1